ncbi:MAG: hypothetical protein IT371_21085 [Deltaproteobacteria bacterium]|nr:hypothetical protein [Deltaproteobacteria bacterium]
MFRSRRVTRAPLAIALVLLGASCASTEAPEEGLPTRAAASCPPEKPLCYSVHLPVAMRNASAATARFEPPDGQTYYGMGQVLGRYADETKPAVDAVGVHPVLVSGYGGCTVASFNWLVQELAAIDALEGRSHVPVWGIGCDLAQLLSGALDAELQNLGRALKAHGRPVFVRPFYEIMPPGGYGQIIRDYCAAQVPRCDAPQTARALYRRLFEQVQLGAMGSASQRIPNVVRVWHAWAQANPGAYDAYYPGDDVVDWIGGSIFDNPNSGPGSMSAFPTLTAFARAHERPVIIPEASPVWPNAGAGACDGPYGTLDPNIVPNFFDPYFALIRQEGIKAFVYISADWRPTQWCRDLGWPDARLEQSAAAVARFRREVSNTSVYVTWPY